MTYALETGDLELLVYRRLDNRSEGLDDQSPRGWELHKRRGEALREAFADVDGVVVREWGNTFDEARTHEFVQLWLAFQGAPQVAAMLAPFVVPAVSFVGDILSQEPMKTAATEAVKTATAEVVKWVIGILKGKQDQQKILDYTITLPDRSSVRVYPPEQGGDMWVNLTNGSASIRIEYGAPQAEVDRLRAERAASGPAPRRSRRSGGTRRRRP